VRRHLRRVVPAALRRLQSAQHSPLQLSHQSASISVTRRAHSLCLTYH
jgi:hypothetical protein